MKNRVLTLAMILALSTLSWGAVTAPLVPERRNYQGYVDKKYYGVASETCIADSCFGRFSVFAIMDATRPYALDVDYSNDNMSNVRIKRSVNDDSSKVEKPSTETLTFLKKGLKRLRVPENLYYRGP